MEELAQLFQEVDHRAFMFVAVHAFDFVKLLLKDHVSDIAVSEVVVEVLNVADIDLFMVVNYTQQGLISHDGAHHSFEEFGTEIFLLVAPSDLDQLEVHIHNLRG